MVKARPPLKMVRQSIIIVLAIFTLSFCSVPLNNALAKVNPSIDKRHTIGKKSQALLIAQRNFKSKIAKLEVKNRILNQYSSWKGVRYRLGGTSKKGVDCSAFVQITFREQFGVKLPRATLQQRNVGKAVKASQLKIGDLLLFQTNRTTRHIGIYLGNNKFVHSSTSVGVTISDLDNSYWSKRYREARRVLKT